MAETRYVGWSAADSTYVCDGTNDEVQINQALAWAASNPNNIVYLRGPYTYDIRNPVSIGNFTELTGDATAKLRLYNNASSSVWYKQIHMIKQSAGIAKSIKIHGFEIDGNRWNQTGSEGDGLHNAIGLRGNSNDPGTDIEVYDMYIHDSLGDGCRFQFIQNDIKIHDNRMEVMGHEDVFLIQCSGAEVWDNTFKQKCNSCVRTDNCQNVKIHDNLMNKSGYSSGAGNGAIQIGNEPSSYGLTWLTQEIEIYNNTINDGAGSGILLMDAYRTAGTKTQTVHIHHNKLVGCGWSYSYKYNAGISCWYWGNGATIEYNTVEGSYNAGLLIFDGYSGCKIQVNDNNIVNSKKTQATIADRKLPVSGYGVLNMIPSKMSVRLENNYSSGNVSGNYYQVNPLTEATAYLTNSVPAGDSGGEDPDDDDDDDIIDPDTGDITIPAIMRLQKDDSHEYIPGWTGYIDDAPFRWLTKQVDVAKSNGQDKIPGALGWALTDFNLEGAELVLDCGARSLPELFRAAASLRKQGRITVELGGDFVGYQASGILGDFSSDLKLKTTIPRKWHPYSFSLLMDLPCYESVLERIRSRYISSSGQFSASNCYKGNILSNSSFEYWSLNQSFAWTVVTNPADVNFKRIRWSKELRMFCAVANSGTDNRVLVYDTTWRLPYGLSNANKNNDWGGLCWCPDWMLWVAMATAGTSGYLCMTSPDTDTWTAKATPAGANGFAWENCLFIPPNETLTTGRVIAFASAGTGNRVLYSDDQCATWTQVASAINTNAWTGADYSPELGRICGVARSGSATQRVMTSDDFGATWTAQDCPAQAWESVKWISPLSLFVACSTDGTQQIMTSPTGLTGTWTLRDTPVLGDYVIPGTGTDVQTLHYITQTGYNYSTDSTTYNNDAGVPDRVIPALTNGHIWRLDRVFCSLRAQYSGRTAYCRVTIQAASLYGGVETQIAEFTETSTTYQEKSLAVSIESATNETVTLRFWGKTSNSTSKAVISLAGCDVTEFNGAGGSTIGYTRGEWKDIEYSPELNVIVCVSQTGVENNILQGNGIMYSTSAVDWIVSYAPVNNANQSVAYSAYYNMFAIVASSGTGTRLLTSNLFGQVLGPENWNLGEGANRSADAAIDGIYSLQIEGDGVTQIIGLTTQKLSISAGERYILLGYCTISGLTAGSARADIVSGTMVIKELNFTADCDWTQQRISFKLNVAHDDIYLRVYGYNLNDGAIIKFDKLLVERASDFEEGATGSDIATFGTEDVIPDVVIAGVEYNPDGSSAGETITYTTPANVVDASSAVTYEEIFTDTLLARTDGGAYKLDKVFGKLRTAKLNYAAYMKVTVTAASKNGGAEYTIAEWTAGMLSTEYEKKGRDVSIVFAENEAVTIKFYLMSKVAAGRAEAMEMGYTYTEMAYGFATTENLYLWNNADTSKVMKCCNKIYPKYIMEINRDGTGSLSYSENFLNESILYIATSAVFTTYDAIKDCLFIDDAGSIVLPFDCMCPISGVPYINLYVVSGNPQISISYDANGSPEMFWPVDGNQSTAAEQAEMFRLLNNADHVILNNRTKFYLKIEPYGSNTCEISSLFVDIKTSTIDVERFKLYKGGEANTIGAQVDGRCSAVVTLRYHDWDPAV